MGICMFSSLVQHSHHQIYRQHCKLVMSLEQLSLVHRIEHRSRLGQSDRAESYHHLVLVVRPLEITVLMDASMMVTYARNLFRTLSIGRPMSGFPFSLGYRILLVGLDVTHCHPLVCDHPYHHLVELEVPTNDIGVPCSWLSRRTCQSWMVFHAKRHRRKRNGYQPIGRSHTRQRPCTSCEHCACSLPRSSR